MARRGRDIVKFSVDHAEFLGDDRGGVYYQAGKGPKGWYVTTVVDAEHFVDTMHRDDGPYPTESAALCAGANAAADWAMDNGVRLTQRELRKAFSVCKRGKR